mgnify:CR=1 FL=1
MAHLLSGDGTFASRSHAHCVGRSAIVNCNTYQDRSSITLTYSKLHVSDDEAAAVLNQIVENLVMMAS